jgi:hypothetical protein
MLDGLITAKGARHLAKKPNSMELLELVEYEIYFSILHDKINLVSLWPNSLKYPKKDYLDMIECLKSRNFKVERKEVDIVPNEYYFEISW